jgi:gamma-glutamylcyclotransferase (GGCT)/AIG2-like uncharacterized protein YtfP
MTRIFVYGTLKRGCHNHAFMAGQQFLGVAETVAGFTLFDLGGYPGMVPSAGCGLGVSGEVWEVDDACLERLDGLERTSEGEYRRQAVALAEPFAQAGAQAYVYLRSVEGFPAVGSAWTE